MVSSEFDQFFHTATSHEPFEYQRLLAGGDTGTTCASRLINVPTGLGKTAAIIMAWLWNRLKRENPSWPRRLIYCLPMRSLVEQTERHAAKWLKGLGLVDTVGLHILMGGEESEDWDLEPAKPAVLIGTQDMLLSRALNRGYGMSRYRWPMHFGLLNNDCLWVLDEIQLMGPGLTTACQLEALRLEEGTTSAARFNSYPKGRSVTWYSSATADASHLQTRDWRKIARNTSFLFGLSPEEETATHGAVAERRLATKSLELQRTWSFGERQKAPPAERISKIIEMHQSMNQSLCNAPGSIARRTLIICNTVDRAVNVHRAISERLVNDDRIDLMLMHSRFRAKERQLQTDRIQNPITEKHIGGQIIVATQVVEAGVDISSAILWTEIAPLSSLVQRFGRLNRTAEFGFNKKIPHGFTPKAIVVGIESPDPDSKERKTKEQKEADRKDAERKHMPYKMCKCKQAWEGLGNLDGDASTSALAKITDAINASIERCSYSLQSHELLDFFDTDANLSLGFTDVSPFVRGTDEDTDIYVAWRHWEGSDRGNPPHFTADFQRQELCPVSIGKAKEARAILSNGWIWRGRDAGWGSLRNTELTPGMTVLLHENAGGYREDSGWTGSGDDSPVPTAYEKRITPKDEDALSILTHGWQSIEHHTKSVTAEWQQIAEALGVEESLDNEVQKAAITAIRWHDIGKNHPKWQSAVKSALEHAGIAFSRAEWPAAKFSLSESPRLTGKTGAELRREVQSLRQSFSPRLDHEVASSLAFRQSQQTEPGKERTIESLLTEYLIMSHHGRVRKVLRDEIPRFPKTEKAEEVVRGIALGDTVPEVIIDGLKLGCESLSIDCRRMGRDAAGNESYTRGVLRLLDHYGPFQLAFFECLFRAADIRASRRASEQTKVQNIL